MHLTPTASPAATTPETALLSMDPRVVVSDRKTTKKFVKVHLETALPDLTDLPEVPHESMLYWKKRSTKDRKQPHSVLKGLCAK